MGRYINFNNLAIILVVGYAFLSHVAGIAVLNQNTSLHRLFLIIMGLSLLIGMCSNFVYQNKHIYVNKYFFVFLFLLIFLALEAHRSNQLNELGLYSCALSIPLVMVPKIKNTKKVSIILVIFGLFLFIGILLNYIFPLAYISIAPSFFGSKLMEDAIDRTEEGVTYPGFISLVSLAAYYLSIAFGALFCFRKNVFKKYFYPIAIILVLGMIMTGKRGPFLWMCLTLLIINLLESKGIKQLKSFIQLLLGGIIFYWLLGMFINYTDNAAIERIFEMLQNLVEGQEVSLSGRDDLWEQAMIYFSNNMLFGIGWDNFRQIYTFEKINTYVHNIYLQLLCEVGIVGFCLFMMFFIRNLWGTLRKANYAKKHGIGYEYSWLLFSLYMQIYFLLYGISGNVLYDVEEFIIYMFAVGIGYLPLLSKSEDNDCISLQVDVDKNLKGKI